MKKSNATSKSSLGPSSSRHPGKSKPATSSNSLFAFGGAGADHDFSDLDDDPMVGKLNTSGLSNTGPTGATSFSMLDDSGGFTGGHALPDDNDDDMDLATSWNFSSTGTGAATAVFKKDPQEDGGDEDDAEDDAWVAARGASAAQKALDKERRDLEEKMRAEAEATKGKHIAEATAMGKRKLLERREREAEEAQQRLIKEKEERDRAQKAREQAFQTLQAIQPTVDLDAQRDVMKEYEQSFYDKDLGGGESPSSDFGF